MFLWKLGRRLTTAENLISIRSECNVLLLSFFVCEDKPEIMKFIAMESVFLKGILNYLHTLLTSTTILANCKQ